jgi:hypothetical protein
VTSQMGLDNPTLTPAPLGCTDAVSPGPHIQAQVSLSIAAPDSRTAAGSEEPTA